MGPMGKVQGLGLRVWVQWETRGLASEFQGLRMEDF